ncbi:dihydrodipicolinate synthase family protein [Kitasatospora albolonga]|uniref:dihydrodipicolinate synthase family protein n=1 Tax=Kitasatospora albolonga TaxID=68173 RepID=UPI003CD05FE0
MPTVVGIADLTTRSAVERARFAERAGADVVMVLPLSYWRLDEREVVRHFTAVADAVSVPVMIYNNPATAGVDLSPELMVRLVRTVENITMVKESSGDIQRLHRLHRAHRRRAAVLQREQPAGPGGLRGRRGGLVHRGRLPDPRTDPGAAPGRPDR